LGNPPFIGKHLQNEEQKKDIDKVLSGVKGSGILDYVTCWYIKAAKYIQDSNIKVAFVSTNSISQGEQVGVLWNELFNNYKIKIHFAHRTFKWFNEARGKAAVYVVIIGFAEFDVNEKYLFEYEDVKGEPHNRKVSNLNPYLVEGSDITVAGRKNPLCNVPEMLYGNKIVDEGHYLFTSEEKESFLKTEPNSAKYFKRILSGSEFLYNEERWCLFLRDAKPDELRLLPQVMERIELVRKFRASSKKEQTRELAKTPTLFGEPRQPESDFLLIPCTTSENRYYIPISFFTKDYIVHNSCIALPSAKIYHFGILTSLMHMTWTRYVCGRLESRFRYSNTIVYNNFPWPENATDKQIKTVEEKAQNVLDSRKEFPNSSLADLYDPLTMPPVLVKAHQELDRAVDLCYRPQPFPNETKRIEFLFELYEKYTNPLLSTKSQKKLK
jgi:hypothetical protein